MAKDKNIFHPAFKVVKDGVTIDYLQTENEVQREMKEYSKNTQVFLVNVDGSSKLKYVKQ